MFGPSVASYGWRAVSSNSSRHPQEVLLAQFSLYVHKVGLHPHLFHFCRFQAQIIREEKLSGDELARIGANVCCLRCFYAATYEMSKRTLLVTFILLAHFHLLMHTFFWLCNISFVGAYICLFLSKLHFFMQF